MARGPRLPQEVVRTVPVLFPRDQPATPEQLVFYRAVRAEHGPYVFAVDRQSDNAELLRQQATGQIRRVEAITAMARQAGYLKLPVLLDDRAQGELAYQFDRRFWFLDGETKNATGYTANVNARPEFWRAFLLAKALAQAGCGPAAFIIGEATRLFRDRKWLTLFSEALWDHQIRLFVGSFGEITPATFPGLLAMIQALSSWLPEARRGAREARRRKNELMQKERLHLGVLAAPDGKGVLADPAVWPLLRELCFELADGRLETLAQGAAWLAARGVVRSSHWLRQLFQQRPILDGYYNAHWKQMTPRRLECEHLRDLDVNPNGHRRYLVELREDPLLLAIDFAANGMEPIPPEILLRARQRITGSGRPRRKERLPGLFLSGRYVRCAVCGSPVTEMLSHGEYPGIQCQPPHVQISSRQSDEYREKVERARALEHRRYAALEESLSAQVWRTLSRAVELTAPDPRTALPTDEAGEEERLRREVARSQAALDDYMAGLGTAIRLGKKAQESFERQAAGLAQRAEEAQQRLNGFSAGLIRRRQQDTVLGEFQQILRAAQAILSDAQKAELIELVVEKIEVHLEERWYKIHVNLSEPVLRGLVGQWGVPLEEKNTPCTRSILFQAKLLGSWAA